MLREWKLLCHEIRLGVCAQNISWGDKGNVQVMRRLQSFGFEGGGNGNLCWPAIPQRPKFSRESLTGKRMTVVAESKFIPELLLVKPSTLAAACVTFLSWVIFQLYTEFYQVRDDPNLGMHLI